MFSLYLTCKVWQQKFIVKAYPIDGHICTVMNPIQWRDKWRRLGEVPGQRGPIKHVSIVLNTMDMTGCRHNSLEVLHVSRGLLSSVLVYCCCLQTDTIPVSSLQTSEDTETPLARGAIGFSTDHWCCQPEKATVIWINHPGSVIICPSRAEMILPFSGSQSHRQTWELLVAWDQREYL